MASAADDARLKSNAAGITVVPLTSLPIELCAKRFVVKQA
jgi:hypothetical protein